MIGSICSFIETGPGRPRTHHGAQAGIRSVYSLSYLKQFGVVLGLGVGESFHALHQSNSCPSRKCPYILLCEKEGRKDAPGNAVGVFTQLKVYQVGEMEGV